MLRAEISKKYVFYLSGHRRPEAKDIFDEDYFILYTPSLGGVNFKKFELMTKREQWEFLAGCFEVICEGLQVQPSGILERLEAVEKVIRNL